MSAPVAWETAPRVWHVTLATDLWQTLCGLAVPTKPLSRVSRIRGRDRGPTCSKCLRELEKRSKLNIKLEA